MSAHYARACLFASAAVLAAACGSRAPAPQAGSSAVAVSVAPVAVSDVEEALDAGGVVRPRLRASLSSRIVAPVERVNVTAGSRVRAGQAVLALDARQIDADAARATAALEGARRGAEAATADKSAAAAALVLARKTHQRIADLQGTRSATLQELDEAAAALASADARATAAEARAIEAEQGAAAAADTARAARVAQTYATLTSPFDGIVTARAVDPGALAAPGVPLLQIETDDLFTLDVSVDEAWAARLSDGTPLDVTVETLQGRPLAGHVQEIQRIIDPASHAVTVRIALPRTPGLRSGMFGRARIPGEPRRALVIADSSLVRHGQLTFVYVNDHGVARLRMVRTTPDRGGRSIVTSGLVAGDPVVLDPPAALQDGQAIVVKGSR